MNRTVNASELEEMEYFTESELLQRYDEMLDDIYGNCSVAGYEYATSNLLKEVDPIAYQTGFNDWLDAEGFEEVGTAHYTKAED